MQFLSVLKPTRSTYRPEAANHPHVAARDTFEYELIPSPAVEGVSAVFGLRRVTQIPPKLWSAVEAGAHFGWTRSRDQGVRFCCMNLQFLSADYFGKGKTPFQVRRPISECVRIHFSQLADPIPPLRAEWLTSDVVALARGIHANAALDGLPALTDALLEAGCDDPLAIEHLLTCSDRGPMCWVVEMICAQAARRDGTSG